MPVETALMAMSRLMLCCWNCCIKKIESHDMQVQVAKINGSSEEFWCVQSPNRKSKWPKWFRWKWLESHWMNWRRRPCKKTNCKMQSELFSKLLEKSAPDICRLTIWPKCESASNHKEILHGIDAYWAVSIYLPNAWTFCKMLDDADISKCRAAKIRHSQRNIQRQPILRSTIHRRIPWGLTGSKVNWNCNQKITRFEFRSSSIFN